MVGSIGQILHVGAAGRVGGGAPVVRAGSALGRAADRVDIGNFATIGGALPAAAQRALNELAVGDGALAETAGILGDVKGLVEQGDYSADDAESKQLKIDAHLASVDRIGQTARFDGTALLDGTAVIAVAGRRVTLPAVDTGLLGESGDLRTLADLRSGGELAVAGGDAAGALKVVDTAVAQIASARGDIAELASYARGGGEEAAFDVSSMQSIREVMLAGGTGGVGEANRASVARMLGN